MKSARVGVIVPEAYQELEFWYPVLRLREDGAAVTVIGANGDGTHTSKLGYPVIPDVGLSATKAGDFDALIVIGGEQKSRAALDKFVGEARAANVLIAATSSAATPAMNGVIAARSADEMPGFFRVFADALAAREKRG